MTEAWPGLDGAGRAAAAFPDALWPDTPPLGIPVLTVATAARRA